MYALSIVGTVGRVSAELIRFGAQGVMLSASSLLVKRLADKYFPEVKPNTKDTDLAEEVVAPAVPEAKAKDEEEL